MLNQRLYSALKVLYGCKQLLDDLIKLALVADLTPMTWADSDASMCFAAFQLHSCLSRSSKHIIVHNRRNRTNIKEFKIFCNNRYARFEPYSWTNYCTYYCTPRPCLRAGRREKLWESWYPANSTSTQPALSCEWSSTERWNYACAKRKKRTGKRIEAWIEQREKAAFCDLFSFWLAVVNCHLFHILTTNLTTTSFLFIRDILTSSACKSTALQVSTVWLWSTYMSRGHPPWYVPNKMKSTRDLPE